MARIKVKLRELRDGNVQFISVVDRAATRIPWRVLKRDGENEMFKGIDLGRVFKSDSPKPEVTAVVVHAQKDEQLSEAVRQSIAEAGLSIDMVQKAEGDVVVYKQAEAEDAVLIRLSDQMVVAVKGFEVPEKGIYAQAAEADGYYHGMAGVVGHLANTLDQVMKFDDPEWKKKAQEAVNDFTSFATSLISQLPQAVLKADQAINELVSKAEACAKEKEMKEEDVLFEEEKQKMTEEEKDKKEEETAPVVDPPVEEPVQEPVQKPDEPVQKPDELVQEPVKEEVQKVDLTPILEALTAIQTVQKSQGDQLAALAQKIENVASEQENQKKVLDATTKKVDDAAQRLSSTVAAPPAQVREERPAGGTAQKSDDDPRSAASATGTWDTAYVKKRDRIK